MAPSTRSATTGLAVTNRLSPARTRDMCLTFNQNCAATILQLQGIVNCNCKTYVRTCARHEGEYVFSNRRWEGRRWPSTIASPAGGAMAAVIDRAG